MNIIELREQRLQNSLKLILNENKVLSPTNLKLPSKQEYNGIIIDIHNNYGFIRSIEYTKIFFHLIYLTDDQKASINIGTKIKFRVIQDPYKSNKMKAVQITLL